MRRPALAALTGLVLLLCCVPAADAASGITSVQRLMTSTAGASVIDRVAVDVAGRIFVLGGAGHVFVLSSTGEILSEWNARPSDSSGVLVRTTVSDGGEVFSVDAVAGTIARWTWDGQLISRWETQLTRVISLGVAPDGSVLVRHPAPEYLKRFSPEGRFLGWLPGPVGEPVFTSSGRLWTAEVATVTGTEANGRPFVSLGNECPIGGDHAPGTCWFGLGTFNTSGRPLSIAATANAGVIVADAGSNRVQAFSTTGRLRFACTRPIAGETPIAVASRQDALVLATQSVLTTQTSLYLARFGAGADVACRQPPLRLSDVRIQRHRGRLRLSFALSKSARTMIGLVKQQVFDCAGIGVVPMTPTNSCVALGRRHSLPERSRTQGRHTLVLARCRKPLPCLARGTWLLTVRAVDRGGNQADAAWQSVRF